jgi:hypothetical protein
MPQTAAKSKRLIALERRWLRRFGEPPAITAHAALLARILRETPAAEQRP